jgi:hypothetical protein
MQRINMIYLHSFYNTHINYTCIVHAVLVEKYCEEHFKQYFPDES